MILLEPALGGASKNNCCSSTSKEKQCLMGLKIFAAPNQILLELRRESLPATINL